MQQITEQLILKNVSQTRSVQNIQICTILTDTETGGPLSVFPFKDPPVVPRFDLVEAINLRIKQLNTARIRT